jgi:hypothetical protein
MAYPDVRIGILAPSRSLTGTTQEQVHDLARTLADHRAVPMRLLLLPSGVSSSASSPETFDRSRSRLNDLRAAVGATHALVLPGPWDARVVDRTSAATAIAALRRWSDRDQDEFWNDPACPQRRLVDESFSGFREPFGSGLAPLGLTRGLLPGDCSFTFETDHLRIGVVALNTVFRAAASLGKMTSIDWEISAYQFAKVFHGEDAFAFAARHDALILATYASREALSVCARREYDAINPCGRFAVHASACDGRTSDSHAVRGEGAEQTIHLALGPDPIEGSGGRGVAALDFQMRSGGIVSIRARSWQVKVREEERASVHERASLRSLVGERNPGTEIDLVEEERLREALAATWPSRQVALELARRNGWRAAWSEVAGSLEDLWGAIVRVAGNDDARLRELAQPALAVHDAGHIGTGLRTVPTEEALRRLAHEMLPTRELALAFCDSLIDTTSLLSAQPTSEELLGRLFQEVDRRIILEQLERWDPAFFKRRAKSMEFESAGVERPRAARLRAY